MNIRTNCSQVTRARSTYGQRHGESKSSHHEYVPKQRRVQGKGGVWSRHYHDASEPMVTYTPTYTPPPPR